MVMSTIPSRILGGFLVLLVAAVALNLGAEHRLDLDASTSVEGRSGGRHDNQVQGNVDKPDFSGRWILESPSVPGPDVPRSLALRQPLVVRTTVTGTPMAPAFWTIAIDRELASGSIC
jgi:hypothetical protein